MRNAVAAILAVAMLITSALIALEIAVLMRTPLQIVAPERGAGPGSTQEALLGAFYDAANAVLAGERAPLLATVVSPELETHAALGAAARGEAGIRSYLEGMRQAGDTTLEVVQLIGQGSDVAAVVNAHERPSVRRRRVDLFRIEAGVIVGYWPGEAGSRVSASLPSVTMPGAAESMGVSLSRLEIGPDAEPTLLEAPVPHLLLVETGTFAVSREHPFELARAGERTLSPMAPDPAAEDLVLGSGDAALVPAHLPLRVTNPGRSSASALSFLVAPGPMLFEQLRAYPSNLATVEGMHDAWRIGRRTAWANDTITETLAVKLLPDSQGARGIALQGSQRTLGLGQRLAPLPPGALRLAIVRSGIVGVSVINSDAVGISVPHPGSQLAVAANHLFWGGDAFWIEATEAPVLANAGGAPLDILLIEVVPIQNDSAAPPMPYATEPLET